MNTAVDPVLELLEQQGIPMPPKQIVYVLNNQGGDAPSRSSVMRALDDLDNYGLIRQPENTTYYEITEKGRRYLSEDLDASELEPEDG